MNKKLPLIEILVCALLFQVLIWTQHQDRIRVVTSIVLWITLTTLKSSYTSKDMGFTLPSWEKIELIVIPLALVVGLIYSLGWLCGSLQTDTPYRSGTFVERKFGYVLGALVQQFVLQGYILIRLEKLEIANPKLIASACFACCHVPNPVLAPITFAGGLVTTTLFQRYRSLWLTAVCHGIVGAAMAEFLPSWVMRVGIGFLKTIAQQ